MLLKYKSRTIIKVVHLHRLWCAFVVPTLQSPYSQYKGERLKVYRDEDHSLRKKTELLNLHSLQRRRLSGELTEAFEWYEAAWLHGAHQEA